MARYIKITHISLIHCGMGACLRPQSVGQCPMRARPNYSYHIYIMTEKRVIGGVVMATAWPHAVTYTVYRFSTRLRRGAACVYGTGYVMLCAVEAEPSEPSPSQEQCRGTKTDQKPGRSQGPRDARSNRWYTELVWWRCRCRAARHTTPPDRPARTLCCCEHKLCI